ncbi:DUF6562 domain-containing protein [Bacteroides nordii]|uniref:DUF6562 domain-containing protein n=1 Tax=Bacteroides nordii TaxID=291645 RepID=UPI002A7EB734|nr:DUF6562 domain-containing protein [Bacteroides nordii]
MKHLVYIVTLFFLSLCASCSQEEVTNTTVDKGGNVSISLTLPEKTGATRAPIEIAASHKLRCILEVRSKDATSVLVHRDEMAVTAGDIPAFNFQLVSGEYECLFWVDFIPRENSVAEVITEEGITYQHFTDAYYNTTDLRAVTINDATALFDNDLCYAFFAKKELDCEAENITTTVILARPFGKLTLKEEGEELTTLRKMKVEYPIPSQFNVSTGEPGIATIMATYEKEFAEDNANPVLFSNCLFASSAPEGKALEAIKLTFTTTEEIKGCTIAKGMISLKQNEHKSAKGTLIAGGEVTEQPETNEKPKVGDFFFLDGTWNSELTETNQANCIGIVFATEVGMGDDISNYTCKEILGYVMALNNVTGEGILSGITGNSNRAYLYRQSNGMASVDKFPAGTENKTDYNGYKVTSDLKNSDLYKINEEWSYPVLTHLEKNWTVQVPDNASNWYIPSFAQLMDMIIGCYGNGDVAKIEALSAAYAKVIELKIGKTFNTDSKARPLITSTLNGASEALMIQLKSDGTDIKSSSPGTSSVGYIRPVLTLISK